MLRDQQFMRRLLPQGLLMLIRLLKNESSGDIRGTESDTIYRGRE